MSQKVKITGVRHVGASVYLGHDKYGNEKYSRNPEIIVGHRGDTNGAS